MLFRTLLLQRTRLPLQTTEVQWECGSQLDKLGRHPGSLPEIRQATFEGCRTLSGDCVTWTSLLELTMSVFLRCWHLAFLSTMVRNLLSTSPSSLRQPALPSPNAAHERCSVGKVTTSLGGSAASCSKAT